MTAPALPWPSWSGVCSFLPVGSSSKERSAGGCLQGIQDHPMMPHLGLGHMSSHPALESTSAPRVSAGSATAGPCNSDTPGQGHGPSNPQNKMMSPRQARSFSNKEFLSKAGSLSQRPISPICQLPRGGRSGKYRYRPGLLPPATLLPTSPMVSPRLSRRSTYCCT